MNIISAITDKNLFRPFLADEDDSVRTWRNWSIALRCLYGLKLKPEYSKIIKTCTGRSIESMPKEGFDVSLFITGRRSGKSRIAAIVGAFEAVLSGKEKRLAKGEVGRVAIVSPTVKQSRIVKSYLRAIFETHLLKAEVVSEGRDGFELKNGVVCETLVGDWKSIRGYSVMAAIVDEAAFFGLDAESKVRSDTELIRALLPSLSTIGGRLIAITSPYARRGWVWNQHKKYFGNDEAKTLVWVSPSRTMNSTLPKGVVDAAMVEDMQSAKSEYLAEFRDDVCIWLPLESITACVKKTRFELLPRSGERYFGFVDVSGGRNDDAAICIGHRNNDKKVICDYIQRYRPPHNPYEVIGRMSEVLKKYKIRKITGDNYSAEFVSQAFKSNGISYEKCKLPKSALYLELIGITCSHNIELLDDAVSITQLANLERRTRSGGKDIVDHAHGGHDDSANAIAGLAYISSSRNDFSKVLAMTARLNRSLVGIR